MKKLLLLFVPAVLLMLTGCPLQTEKPIDSGSYPVPAWITGKWTSALGTNYDLKVVKGKLGTALYVEYDSAGNPNKGASNAILFSKIADKVFVSIYANETVDANAGYYLFLFKKISDREIELTALKENSVSFSASSDAIKKWLTTNKDNKAIYDSTDISRFRKE
jgi:hypothetical protein